jgi:heavy metal translocating P-type ATPase
MRDNAADARTPMQGPPAPGGFFETTVGAPHGRFVELSTPARRREAGRIVLVGVIALSYWMALVPLWALLIAVAIGLYPLAITGLQTLRDRHRIGTELFVTAATVIAVAGGEYVAAAVLMTIILIAEFIADFNTDRARASIKALIGATPRTGVIRGADGEQTVPVDKVQPGTVVLVRAGERIPIDGTVIAGTAAVNEASITGESIPVDKGAGGSVLAGTIVESGAIDVNAEKVGADTMFGRIVALVEHADSVQAPVQKLADRVANWLVPAVLIFLVAVFLVTRDVRKIVALLIFTSPAELGLATPMVMIAAIARAARHGILVKGGLHLEQLAKVDAVVFDKTGTLTFGEPRVVGVIVHDAAFSEAQVLRYAAAADRRSAHPIAKAVVTEAGRRGIAVPDADDFRTMHGFGVTAVVDAREVLVGNQALMDRHAVLTARHASADVGGATVAYVAVDGALAGTLCFTDHTRPGAADAIGRLRAAGIARLVMVTGDHFESATRVGQELGISDVRASLLPEDKTTAIEALRRVGHTVAMVGDGVNDAPALARADVGIAMGARGTQAAIEAADIALMTDDLDKIVVARTLARRAYRTIQENLLFGVGVVHVLGIAAALIGWIGPIQAALLHIGPDVLVFLNSTKLLRVRL